MVESYSYDVFGEPNRTSDVNNPYLFTGRRFDPETANYYYRARYYKPTIGRFLQPDPISYDDGLNLYAYVRNNPVMNVDPYGLEAQPICCKIRQTKVMCIPPGCTTITSCTQNTIYSECPPKTACCHRYGNNKNITVYEAKPDKCCWCNVYINYSPVEIGGVTITGASSHAEINVDCDQGREDWAADVGRGARNEGWFIGFPVRVSVQGFSSGGKYVGRISCDAADKWKAKFLVPFQENNFNFL